MPYRQSSRYRKRSRYAPRRRGRRSYIAGRRKGQSSVLTVPRGVSGLPDRIRMKCKWSTRVALTSTSGAYAPHIFAGNGPFDPDTSGAGNQPTYYDEMSAMYLRQLTYGSSIDLRIGNAGVSAGAQNYVYAVSPITTATAPTTMPDTRSLPYTRWRLGNLSDRGNNINHYMSTARILGQPKQATAITTDVSSVIGALPAREWFWLVAVESLDQSTTSIEFIYVTITYYIEFYERKTLEHS